MGMVKFNQLFQLVFRPQIIRFGFIRSWDLVEFDRMNPTLILIHSGPNHPLSAHANLLQ
jgi:hypothetical protein